MKLRHTLLTVLLFSLSMSPLQAMDMPGFKRMADQTIRQMSMGVVGDIDALIAMQEELMVIGMEGSVEYLRMNPEKASALELTVLNAEAMKSMQLDEIEKLWHEGEFLKSKGIDPDKLDHFGPLVSLMDSIIHPATSYIALKDYKRTGNPALLQRAKAELMEVMVHLDQLANSRAGQQIMASQ